MLLAGGALFLVGAALLLLWMEGRSGVFLGIGLGSIFVAAVTLAVAGRLMAREPNDPEGRRQQRLWRSGPLGRTWLGRRGRFDK